MTAVLPPRAGAARLPVIELDNGAGHSTYETEAVARLAILGPRIDRVEIVSSVPPMAPR